MNYYDEAAQWYDLLSTGTPGDVEFYLKEAKNAKGKVLEVACGSGRIYLDLLDASIDAYGFDLSEGMIDVLRQKAKKRKLESKLNVKVADMRDFRYPFKFDLIIIPYRAFLHLETREDQKKCLINVRRHLNKGGRLILNFFDPKLSLLANIDIKAKDGSVTNPQTGAKVHYESYSHYDLVNQKISSRYVLSGRSVFLPEKNLELSSCYIFPREFMNLMELCGFKKWALYGGFNYEPYTKHGSELVWIAYK